MTEHMSETDAYLTLCDARATQGWPDDWVAERHTGGWAFSTGETPRTYVVTDKGSVDRVGASETPEMAIDRLS